MRHESTRISFSGIAFTVAFAAFALGQLPLTVAAQPPGDKVKAGPKAGGPDDKHKHMHMHGGDKPGAAAPGAAPAAAKPAAQMPAGADLAKAADGMSANCAKAAEVRGRLEELGAKRRTAQAAIRTAQNEARKQLRGVTAAQKKIERALKKPGTDTAPLFEEARTAHDAATAQTTAVERETQALRAAEDELASLATTAEQAAAACAEAEVTLRTAANEARKAAATARADAAKARGLARLPPPKAQEMARAKQTSDLEALRKSSSEAKGAIDALRSVAAGGGAAPAQPAGGAK